MGSRRLFGFILNVRMLHDRNCWNGSRSFYWIGHSKSNCFVSNRFGFPIAEPVYASKPSPAPHRPTTRWACRCLTTTRPARLTWTPSRRLPPRPPRRPLTPKSRQPRRPRQLTSTRLQLRRSVSARHLLRPTPDTRTRRWTLTRPQARSFLLRWLLKTNLETSACRDQHLSRISKNISIGSIADSQYFTRIWAAI